jgi:hypothetical protein
MTDETVSRPARSSVRTRRFRAVALAGVLLAVAIILWLALRDTGGSSSSLSSSSTAVSAEQIKTLAVSVRHPVFWVGPQTGYTYELTRTSKGSIFIRYLPDGAKVGAKDPYLTVATYPFPGAFDATRKLATQTGATAIPIAHHGVAVPSKNYPQSVHAAYPGVDYQVEIYDPTAGTATNLVTTGRLAAFGSLKPSTSGAQTAKATAASAADLKDLAKSLGHPIYWAGPKKGYTYELLHPPSGQVYIRYLPPGVAVGAPVPYLTVATYPFPSAYGAIQALTKRKGTETIKLSGGGLGEVDSKYPKSIHLAYPKSDYQVEVFDPSPARARRVVTSGQISPIG